MGPSPVSSHKLNIAWRALCELGMGEIPNVTVPHTIESSTNIVVINNATSKIDKDSPLYNNHAVYAFLTNFAVTIMSPVPSTLQSS